jgi:hypothetical protein
VASEESQASKVVGIWGEDKVGRLVAEAEAESVSVLVTELVSGVTEVGLKEAETPLGKPEMLRFTALTNPCESLGATVTASVADFPALRFTDGAAVLSEKSSTVKLTADEAPEGAGLVTVIAGAPPEGTSLAEIAAVILVELRNVVDSVLPPKLRTDPETKFEPLTVSVKAVPAGTLAGESEAMAGIAAGFGSVTETGTESGLSPATFVAETV